MTLDAGIHHLGTKTIHQVPAWAALLGGWALGSDALTSVGIGMMVVLLAGALRCQAPYYRWRVREPGPAAAGEGDHER